MPYFIDDQNCVRQGTEEAPGAVVKCHDTHEQADAHLRALYANVEDADMAKADPNIGGGRVREKLKDSDFVFSDERAFPVVTPADVSDAVSSWGRYKGSKGFEQFRRRLVALCKRKGAAFVRALPKEWKDEMDLSEHLIWYELQETPAADAPAPPVEFLRAGTFTDRRGQVVTITPDDLDAYVASFEANAAGQDVPIDVMHERKEAGGWVRRIWRDGDRLLGDVEWNELGRRLVGDRVYRYLSASLDTAKRVLRSISLVNFPAVKGLAPVELSEGVMALERQPGLMERVLSAVRGAFAPPSDENISVQESTRNAQEGAMVENDKPTPAPGDLEQVKAQVRAELEAELAEKEQMLSDMHAKVRAELEAEMVETFERRGKLREFAEAVCSGDAAISAKADDVVAALEPLTDEQAEAVKALLKAKVVDLSERGHSRDGATGEKLPQRIIKEVRGGGITMEDLENPDYRRILGLNDLSEYDLSDIQAEE